MLMDRIKSLCLNRKIKWSSHAAVRIQERGINRKDVLQVLSEGSVIEEYPTDFPYPSCLVFGYTINQKVLHVVVGYSEDCLYVITAYFPDTRKFQVDLKTRKGEC